MSGPHLLPLRLTSLAALPADQPLPARQPVHDIRLRLTPKAPPTGYVDGGWWPRSRDLTVELPALAHVLGVRLGRVTRVAFRITAWDLAPRQTTVDGHAIRLAGFHSQDEFVVHICGPDRQRVSLLVIPPEATVNAAHEAMMTAARRGNKDQPFEILVASGALPDGAVPRPRLVRDDDQTRWANDGGQVDERD